MTSASQDLKLWQAWKRSQNQTDLQALLNQLQPLIHQQVIRWSGTLSPVTLELQAKTLAVEAIKTYDPKKGAALGTHVTNQLQKLSRTVYTHGQALRLPEHKAVSMASFSVAQQQLADRLGREPTANELADELGWTSMRVQEFQRAYTRKELLTSGEFNPASFPVADQADPMVTFVYHDMAPKTQQLFEHITGFGGKPVLSNKELMAKFKMTQGQLSYQKQKLKGLFDTAYKPGMP